MFDWLFAMLARLPRPEPLPKPHPDFPDPQCKSCGVLLTGWNHNRVPEDVYCCTRCWKKVPVADRLKYGVMLEDRQPDGPIGNFSKMARGVLFRDEYPMHGQGDGDHDDDDEQ